MNGMNDDGSVLSGEELKKYTKQRGLCHICAVTQTHRRQHRGRLLGPFRERKWEPLTVPCPQNPGEYLVYKGFCIQPTCYTFQQAQCCLGESRTPLHHRRAGPKKTASVSSLVSSLSSRSGSRLPQQQQRASWHRAVSPPPLRDATGTSLNTPAWLGTPPLNERADPAATAQPASPSRSRRRPWFRSSPQQAPPAALGAKLRAYLDDEAQPPPPPPLAPQPSPVPGGKGRPTASEEDAATAAGSSSAATSGGSSSSSAGGGAPKPTTGPVLDLSGVRVTKKNLPTLLTAFSQLTTSQHQRLPSVVLLDKCGLGDKGVAAVLKGMVGANLFVEGVSLRDNRIGKSRRKRDGGIHALARYLTHPRSRVADLNLSTNRLTQDAEAVLFCALLPSKTIRRLNLARTKLWDVSLGTQHFFRTNKTLRVLNLEGNCLQAPALRTIVSALIENPDCALETLLLASNALGDKGVEPLCDLLRASRTLTRVSLGKNEITNVGAALLLNTLRRHQSCQAPLKEITGLAENHVVDKNLVLDLLKQLDTIYHNRLFVEEQRRHALEAGTGTSATGTSSFGLTFEPARQSNYARGSRRGGRAAVRKSAEAPPPPPPSHTRAGRKTEDASSGPTGTPGSVPKRIFVGGDGLLDAAPMVRDHSNASSNTSSSHGSGRRGGRRGGRERRSVPGNHHRRGEPTNPSSSSSSTRSAELVLRDWMERTYSSVSSMVSSAASSIRSDQASDFDSLSEMSSLGGSWAGGFSLVDPTEYLGDVLSRTGASFRTNPDEPEEEGIEVDLGQFRSSFRDLDVNDDADAEIFPHEPPSRTENLFVLNQ